MSLRQLRYEPGLKPRDEGGRRHGRVGERATRRVAHEDEAWSAKLGRIVVARGIHDTYSTANRIADLRQDGLHGNVEAVRCGPGNDEIAIRIALGIEILVNVGLPVFLGLLLPVSGAIEVRVLRAPDTSLGRYARRGVPIRIRVQVVDDELDDGHQVQSVHKHDVTAAEGHRD